MSKDFSTGQMMMNWAKDLYPINRSLTGEGVRQTLRYIQDILPNLKIHAVPSGTEVFDWIIPDEWHIKDAYIEDEEGNRVVDFADHNLHVVGYSEPVDKKLDLDELQAHLHSIPHIPDAIPYETSYYRRNWGFCMPHRQRESLQPGTYRAVIDSTLEPGVLNYGELLIPGKVSDEILLSTYVCHPSLANNELSGPVVTTALCKWLLAQDDLHHSYRVVFVPESLGATAYISQNLDIMKKRTVAGFVLTCVGDNRAYSFMPSRYGKTLPDKVARHVLNHFAPEHVPYSFLDRGSDEQRYCSPGVDLPVVSVMRSKYGQYPEYHTSHDDLSVISPEGLQGGFEANRLCLEALNYNRVFEAAHPCQPFLTKHNLFDSRPRGSSSATTRMITNFLMYADGTNDLIDIANLIETPVWDLVSVIPLLKDAELIREL